jgi:hypothetical protein
MLSWRASLTNFGRDYTVSHYWPRPNAPVEQIKTMYSKTLNAELKLKQTNGQANGS